MPLPVSLTTLYGGASPAAPIGPFKSSAGNVYVIGRDSTTATTLRVFKATDPTSSFSSTTQVSGASTAIIGMSGAQYGDLIYVAYAGGSSTTASIGFGVYDMATDSWSVTPNATAINAAVAISGASTPSIYVGIAARSNGDAVCLYNGLNSSVMSAAGSRLYVKVRTGSSWGTAQAVDAGGQNDYAYPQVVIGANDDAHLIWQRTTNAVQHRTLNSSNVLQTASTELTSFTTVRDAVSFVDGANVRVVAIGLSGTTVGPVYFTSAATPTLTAGTAYGTNASAPMRVWADGTTLYSLHRNTVDSDLYQFTSTNFGSTWTQVGAGAAFVGTVASAGAEYLNRGAPVYTRGGNWVLPYVVNDNAVWKYDEEVLRSAGAVPYTITITPAAIPVGGQSLGQAYGRTIAVDPASVPIGGQNVAPVHARTVAVTAASIPITGLVVDPVHQTGSASYSVTITAAAVPVAGQDVAPVFGRTVSISSAPVPIGGASVSTVFAKTLSLTASAVPIVGADVTPTLGAGTDYDITVSPATVPIVGGTVAAEFGRAVSISAAVVPVTGQIIAPAQARAITVTAASVPVVGSSVVSAYGRAITISAGTVPVAGQTVSQAYGRAVSITAGSVPIAGAALIPWRAYAATITSGLVPIVGGELNPVKSGGYAITITSSAIPVDGSTVSPFRTVTYAVTITPSVVPVTGSTVSSAYGRAVTITSGALPIVGQAVASAYGRTVTITAGSLPVTGLTVVPLFARAIAVTAAPVPITGQDVSTVAGGNQAITISPSAVSVTGATLTPFKTVTYAVTVTPSALPITGASLTALKAYVETVTAGSIPIVGAVLTPSAARRIAIAAGSLPVTGQLVAPVAAKAITVAPAVLPIVGASVVLDYHTELIRRSPTQPRSNPARTPVRAASLAVSDRPDTAAPSRQRATPTAVRYGTQAYYPTRRRAR